MPWSRLKMRDSKSTRSLDDSFCSKDPSNSLVSVAEVNAMRCKSFPASLARAFTSVVLPDAACPTTIVIHPRSIQKEAASRESKFPLRIAKFSSSSIQAMPASALDFDVEDVCLRKTALPISRYPSFRIFMWEAVGISSALRPNARANACFAIIRSFTVRKR